LAAGAAALPRGAAPALAMGIGGLLPTTAALPAGGMLPAAAPFPAPPPPHLSHLYDGHPDSALAAALVTARAAAGEGRARVREAALAWERKRDAADPARSPKQSSSSASLLLSI